MKETTENEQRKPRDQSRRVTAVTPNRCDAFTSLGPGRAFGFILYIPSLRLSSRCGLFRGWWSRYGFAVVFIVRLLVVLLLRLVFFLNIVCTGFYLTDAFVLLITMETVCDAVTLKGSSHNKVSDVSWVGFGSWTYVAL